MAVAVERKKKWSWWPWKFKRLLFRLTSPGIGLKSWVTTCRVLSEPTKGQLKRPEMPQTLSEFPSEHLGAFVPIMLVNRAYGSEEAYSCCSSNYPEFSDFRCLRKRKLRSDVAKISGMVKYNPLGGLYTSLNEAFSTKLRLKASHIIRRLTTQRTSRSAISTEPFIMCNCMR